MELTRRRFIRSGLAAAAGSSIALDALCTQPRVAAAAPAAGVSMVGDSLTSGSLPYQADDFAAAAWPAAWIDAHGSRGIRTRVTGDPHTGLTAVDALRARHGDTPVWVVALGTNDAGIFAQRRYDGLIGEMFDRIGSGHMVMWVNVFLPREPSRQAAWNAALDGAAAARPGELTIFDWAAIATEHPTWLAGDNIHYNTTGYQGRSAAIASGIAAVARTDGLTGPPAAVASRVVRF